MRHSRNLLYFISIGNHEHDYSNSDVLDPATGTKPFHPEGLLYYISCTIHSIQVTPICHII